MANIVIMPGGFHPFHAGHAALYNSIKKKYGASSDIYVAASDSQKQRPFPFKIKEKLAQISGVPTGEFVQVRSPFVPKEITDKYDPENDSIVFVRSEKDRNEYPKPGGTKKDGTPGYFQALPKSGSKVGSFKDVGYMDYLPTEEFAGITSATEIRNAWPKLDTEGKGKFVEQIYPHIAGNDKLINNVIKLLDSALTDEITEGDVVPFKRPDLPENIQQLVIDWYGDQNRYTKAQLQSKGYKVEVNDHSTNIVVTDKKGREFTVSVDKAMDSLIQQAYRDPEQVDEVKYVSGFMGADGKPTSTPTAADYASNKEFQNMKKKLGDKIPQPTKRDADGKLSPFKKDKQVDEAFVSPEQLDEGLKEKLAIGILALGLQFSKTNAEEVFVYQDTQGKYVTAYSKEDVPDTSALVYYIDTETDEDGNVTIGEKKWLRFPAIATGDAEKLLQFMPTPKPEFIQKAVDELKLAGFFTETFVDPDQSKQYWNHDSQNVGVGMQIEMPLTDTPNLNGRRQGFNEGEERSIIRDAAINALVNAFEGHEDEFESREAIEANIYSVLSDLDVEDIVDPEMDHHGQRMGNFASGRVIDVVDSSSVIDEVMQQINYFDPTDDRNYVSESLDKIRGMIKETTDEQKSKSVNLHRKLFELFEEERDNVIKLRGFGKETDKKVVDINKARQEKQANQERTDNYYSGRRAEQEELLARLQAELLNAKQEFSELEDAKLLPIEMLDTMESITKLIDYIENYNPDDNDFTFTEEMVDKLHLKTIQLKEYFGGTRDTSAPKVLRQQTPRREPGSYWNKIDLSETADYIEEK